MEVIQKRRLLFLVGCIGARLYLSRFLNKIEEGYQKWFAIVLCCIGIGFWYIYWYGLRKTGAEVFGDVIWWNHLRPLHGTLYVIAGVALLSNDHKMLAWKLIFVDAIIGLVKFLEHHFG